MNSVICNVISRNALGLGNVVKALRVHGRYVAWGRFTWVQITTKYLGVICYWGFNVYKNSSHKDRPINDRHIYSNKGLLGMHSSGVVVVREGAGLSLKSIDVSIL